MSATTPERRSRLEDPAALAAAVRDAALELGFARVGFCPVEPFVRGAEALSSWLRAGHHGEMPYMAGPDDRASPKALLAQARSLVVVALPYARDLAAPHDDRLRGRVARYAVGEDYHLVLKPKLEQLADRLGALCGRPVLARVCVDSAPLLEREAAERAGVGFIAKSTLSIAPGVGSYVLLGELLVDVELAPSAPERSRCGTCTKCLVACPTRAFVDAHVLDARRCISYLTIELRGAIPHELRPLIGTWVFGCDVCQEVCPFNASSQPRLGAPELEARAALTAPDLEELLLLGAAGYRRLVKRTALRRVPRAQLARNAAVALGNLGDPRAVPSLAKALAQDPSTLVRGHAAWALGRLGGEVAAAALRGALAIERDAEVLAEIHRALALSGPPQSSAKAADTGA